MSRGLLRAINLVQSKSLGWLSPRDQERSVKSSKDTLWLMHSRSTGTLAHARVSERLHHVIERGFHNQGCSAEALTQTRQRSATAAHPIQRILGVPFGAERRSAVHHSPKTIEHPSWGQSHLLKKAGASRVCGQVEKTDTRRLS
jgi:hypothetical protein